MSDTKTSGLTAITGANVDSSADVLPIVDTSVTTTKKITRAQLFDISDAAGGQIVFPATQNASAGANTLDDYEEGTWTPAVGGTATYSVQIGRYVKIGKYVWIQCRIAITSIGTGSTTTVSGLPFAAANLGMDQAGVMAKWASLGTNVIFCGCYIVDNDSLVNFSAQTAAGTNVSAGAGILATGSDITFSAVYEAAG